MTVTRTAVVKNLEELFWHAIRASANTIVAARSIGQIITATGASSLVTKITAARGAGHTGSAVGYAVALTAVNSAAVITIGGETATFAEGDPPGTAVIFTGSVDIVDTPTIGTATSGDRFAIVAPPPSYSGGLISYVTASGMELGPRRRDIRDKGALQHRKSNIWPYGGVLNLTALYENAKAGLSKYVDQDIILIGEREDDRGGTVTEKVILYGARINQIPAPNESTGDTDSDVSVPVQFELMAILGES